MDKGIPICFATDANYAVPAYIAIYSLLKNYKGAAQIDIYIMTTDDVVEQYGELFQILEASIHFISIGTQYKNVKINHGHVTTATMYRLLIPKYLPVEKCIYLDSDVVVEGDISELFEVDIEGCCVAGVLDPWLSRNEQNPTLDISTKDYINAGVLLINIEEINRLGLKDKLEEEGNNDSYQSNDQDALNKVFYGRIKMLPLRMNAMSGCLLRNDELMKRKYNVAQARRDPLVFHYVSGPRKPWAYKHIYGADRWWKYVKMQDKDVQDRYLTPFLNKQNYFVYEIIREKVSSIIQYVGVFPLYKKSRFKV